MTALVAFIGGCMVGTVFGFALGVRDTEQATESEARHLRSLPDPGGETSTGRSIFGHLDPPSNESDHGQ